MKTSVEALSEVELKIEVEIPSDRVDREVGRQVGKVGQRARVNGFRPGKAPKALIRKQYGSTIAVEAARALISDSLGAVLDGLDRSPLGEPAIEPGLAQEGEPLKYTVRVQVKPALDIHSWEGIEVSVPPVVVSDEQVAERIAELQRRYTERVPVEDRGADTGDIVVANFEGYLDGARNPRLDGTDVEMKLGSGRMIPGFEDQLMGARAGDKVTVEAAFPDSYGASDLAGKTGRWEVEVLQHLTEEVPAADDDFAQDHGHANLAALEADTRAKIAAEADKDRASAAEQRVVGVLLERNQFKIPPVLHQAAMEERARGMLQILRMQGADQQTAIDIINSNLDGLARAAETTVRRHLALEAFAKAQGIDVDDDALSAAIVERIAQGGEHAAKLYEKPEMRETLRTEMIQRQALDRILASAHIVDEKPEAKAPAA